MQFGVLLDTVQIVTRFLAASTVTSVAKIEVADAHVAVVTFVSGGNKGGHSVCP